MIPSDAQLLSSTTINGAPINPFAIDAITKAIQKAELNIVEAVRSFDLPSAKAQHYYLEGILSGVTMLSDQYRDPGHKGPSGPQAQSGPKPVE